MNKGKPKKRRSTSPKRSVGEAAAVKTFHDVQVCRRRKTTMAFAKNWIAADRNGEYCSEYHLNLSAWTVMYPVYALACILDIIDQVGCEDDLVDSIIPGPVQNLLHMVHDDFVPILKEAIKAHPGFAWYTRSYGSDFGRGELESLRRMADLST